MTLPDEIIPAPDRLSPGPASEPSRDVSNPAPAGWWRRNALALGTIAVLLPATVVGIGWNEWWDYFSGRFVFAVDAGAEGVVEHDGALWGPIASSEATTTEGLDVPPGTRVLIVKIPIDPQREDVRCGSPRLVEQGTGRQWDEMRTELGLPSSEEEPTSCVSEATDPYAIFVPFAVPLDAEGPYWVEIDSSAPPEFVRFEIDP